MKNTLKAGSAWVHKEANLENPIHISDNVTVYGNTHIGRYTFFNVNTIMYPNCSIGRFCSTGRFVELGAAQHPIEYLSSHLFQLGFSPLIDIPEENNPRNTFEKHPQTTIGHDVWIGAKSTIVSGVTIGHGAVIAAGSIVNKDVPPYTIVGGTPAKTIRLRFKENIIEELLKIEWWNLPEDIIKTLPFDDIEKCIDRIKHLNDTKPKTSFNPIKSIQSLLK